MLRRHQIAPDCTVFIKFSKGVFPGPGPSKNMNPHHSRASYALASSNIRAAKVLRSLRISADSPEPSLLGNGIRTEMLYWPRAI